MCNSQMIHKYLIANQIWGRLINPGLLEDDRSSYDLIISSKLLWSGDDVGVERKMQKVRLCVMGIHQIRIKKHTVCSILT